MRRILLSTLLLCFYVVVLGQKQKVEIVNDAQGSKFVIDGEPFIVNGINWDYVPIGTDVLNAGFWDKPDHIIKAGLDKEMSVFKNMGVNAIRTYIGMPPKWITYIYKNYGIYTMINHQFGAYGLTLDGVWYAQTNYADEKTRKHLIEESVKMAQYYKDTPGLLLFMIGNENNYHLTWVGSETDEGIVIDDKDEGIRQQARAMYKLMNDATLAIKQIDQSHPIGICNGDLLYLDIVADECTDVDVYGTNMYRGVSFLDAFDRMKNEYGKPILFTEFGADAYNAANNEEDQYSQAYYMVNNWKEIYENAYGLGKAQNSVGGFTFQSSDGWWKSGFDERKNADIHDTKANWPSNGYSRDQNKPGDKNMNEEWFGICAKGPTNENGLYELYPRASYYALKKAHAFDPFTNAGNAMAVDNHFDKINLMDAVLEARGDLAAFEATQGGKIRFSRLSAEFTSFNTGGSLITTPEFEDPNKNVYPNQLGFDHMQSYFVGIEAQPTPDMRAEVVFNVLGNVAENPIDEIFYENVGRPVTITGVDGGNGVDVEIDDFQRLRVYQAEFEWNANAFDFKGFYRTGHYHWGYEGDLFGLYPEANYGPNLDIYNGEIFGFEFDAKGALEGLKIAAGPQLWWGANPTVLFKYQRTFGKWDIAGIYHRDLQTDVNYDETGRRVLNNNQVRSGVIPPWPTERATLAIERKFGKLGVQLGGIWGGDPLNGSSFQDITDDGRVVVDKVNSNDNWGGKVKFTYEGGKFNWYGQASYMGLVANGGFDQTQTFTGWRLKDSGSGNMVNILSGFTYTMGNFQIAPNFMYQEPLVDPIPNNFGGAARLRNVIDDPFAVRNGNREMYGYEVLFTFDPTPGTWMYQWDNDRAEDAKFAMNLGFVYRRLPTTMDAHIGFLADRTFFPFENSVPAEDLWEVHSRMVSKVSGDLGIIGNFYFGNGQANGVSERTIQRFGFDVRAIYKKWKVGYAMKINDWGPFDYHKDFNLTFPFQTMLDLSFSLGKPDWFILPSTRIGIRGTWRSLDQFSPRYLPTQTEEFQTEPTLSPVGFPNGSEWEIRTYIQINIGQ